MVLLSLFISFHAFFRADEICTGSSKLKVLVFTGAKPGDQASAGAMSGFSSNPPPYLNQDPIYRMNSGVRPGPGAPGFQYGPPGMQPPMRGRPFGGHFSQAHGQFQGPAMNPPGMPVYIHFLLMWANCSVFCQCSSMRPINWSLL